MTQPPPPSIARETKQPISSPQDLCNKLNSNPQSISVPRVSRSGIPAMDEREMSLWDQMFARINLSKSGKLSGKEARGFFVLSQLPNPELKEIW